MNFHEKLNVARKYIESDLNDNAVNLFILTFYDFTYFGDKDFFKKTFVKTSFTGNKLKEDSLYFLMKINLYDSNVEQAEENYQIIKDSGNRNFNFAAKAFSDYYLGSDAQKSLKYHKEFFTFDVLKYVDVKGDSLYYWQNVDRYFLLLEMNNQHDIILRYADSILPFKPNDESWLKKKGQAQFFLKYYDEAVRTYRQLYELENDFQYVQNLLRIYKNGEDTTSIISLLSERLQNDEKDIEIRHLYCQYLEYYELSILKDSLVSGVLSKAANFYTCYVPSEKYYYYSLFQFKKNQYDEAISSLFKAINIDTTIEKSPYRSLSTPPSFYSIYQYYVYHGDWNIFTSKYYHLIAWINEKQGKKNKAIKYYKKSIVCFDCNINSNYRLAYIYKYGFLRSNKKAYTYFEKIVSCDLFEWSSSDARYELARNYYYKKKQPAKAKEILLKTKAWELKSKDYILLSTIYRKEEDFTNSIKMLELAIELETEDWLIEWYGQLKSEIELLMEN